MREIPARPDRRLLLAGAAALAGATLLPRRARAQRPVIRIGVLTDISGPYRDIGGQTSIACARQAVQDFGVAHKDFDVEIVAADHQQKPDIASAIAREWFDRGGVDAVTEVNNSAAAYAVTAVAQAANKVHLNSGALSADLTGAHCSPNLVHWEEDTWAISRTIATAGIATGLKKWFLIVADYAGGIAMQRDLSSFVLAAGGTIVGVARYPFPATTDFSSYLLSAQSSGADVVAFANAAGDFANCVKQAHEFGLVAGGIALAGMTVFVNDIHALGLATARGLVLTETFYWDLHERTRGFTNRVKDKCPDNWPNQEQACTYAAVLHYLKAVDAMGVAQARASGRDAVVTMKRLPTDDDCFGAGVIREDGRQVRPIYLFKVKRPEESHGPWDLYQLLATIPAAEGWRPIAEGKCQMPRI